MAADDSVAPFQRIPWIADLLNQPDIVTCIPPSRRPKSTTEDTLYSGLLKTPRTIRSCVAFHRSPARDEDPITAVTTLYEVGNGMNGHPDIIHGGITATLIDEGMGVLQMLNIERLLQHKGVQADGGRLEEGLGSFTAYLNVKYLKPVQTPAAIAVAVRRVKKEGRKEFLVAELKQWQSAGGDADGDVVVCATAEALFVTPKFPHGSKL